MDESVLLREVEARFVVTAASTPGWASPHPEREPLEEEYSRVSDPAKWRIEGARALAWTLALTGLGLASREEVGAGGVATSKRGGWRVVPRAAGALSVLVVGTRSVDELLVGVELHAGEPPVVVLGPDCHCDACDSGSADVLETQDDAWLELVSGALVHLEAPGRVLTTSRGGWSESRSPGAAGPEPGASRLADREGRDADLAAVRRGAAPDPRWRRVVHGAPWA